MVGRPGSGRRPGFKHSEDTKQKISQAKSMYDLDEKCVQRFEELRANYPDQKEFFEENEIDLLFAMRDVRTEKELSDIRKHIETANLRPEEPYQYSSSSCYAAEDAMIALLDLKNYLKKLH